MKGNLELLRYKVMDTLKCISITSLEKLIIRVGTLFITPRTLFIALIDHLCLEVDFS